LNPKTKKQNKKKLIDETKHQNTEIHRSLPLSFGLSTNHQGFYGIRKDCFFLSTGFF